MGHSAGSSHNSGVSQPGGRSEARRMVVPARSRQPWAREKGFRGRSATKAVSADEEPLLQGEPSREPGSLPGPEQLPAAALLPQGLLWPDTGVPCQGEKCLPLSVLPAATCRRCLLKERRSISLSLL